MAIARGEFLVLVGRSGSGKSTLLNLVAGIDRRAGRCRSSAAISRARREERTRLRRERIGFIFQFFNLVPTLTVLENLLLPLELDGSTVAARRAAR